MATTNYLPHISKECMGCGICQTICPVLAIAMERDQGGRTVARVDEKICLGCGVCVRGCPVNAIRLVKREIEIITPVNSSHRFVVQAIEKGTLQNLIFDNQAFANHPAIHHVCQTYDGRVLLLILDWPQWQCQLPGQHP